MATQRYGVATQTPPAHKPRAAFRLGLPFALATGRHAAALQTAPGHGHPPGATMGRGPEEGVRIVRDRAPGWRRPPQHAARMRNARPTAGQAAFRRIATKAGRPNGTGV